MLVTSKLSHTYLKKQIFIVFKYSVCGSSDCINHCYKRERNQYICKCDSGLKSYSWFYCYHAKRHCKLQQTHFLWVVFPLPLEQVEQCGLSENGCNEMRTGVNHLQILFHVEGVLRGGTRWKDFPGLWKLRRLFKHLLWITYHE